MRNHLTCKTTNSTQIYDQCLQHDSGTTGSTCRVIQVFNGKYLLGVQKHLGSNSFTTKLGGKIKTIKQRPGTCASEPCKQRELMKREDDVKKNPNLETFALILTMSRDILLIGDPNLNPEEMAVKLSQRHEIQEFVFLLFITFPI